MPVWLRSRGLERRSVRQSELGRRAQAMLDALGMPDAELSVLLCDDETIRRLNQRYRKIDASTDVLAFPMNEGPGPLIESSLLGDVVISLPTARRQAAERDRPIIAEVTFLLAHGLLHLLGYDHATKAEEREMSARTADLLAAVESTR
jgi:probable rRNA maturation factor